MSELKLVIGNKNYSSWSQRPWLLLLHHGPLQVWMAAGRAEEEVIREDEVGYLMGEPEWQA